MTRENGFGSPDVWHLYFDWPNRDVDSLGQSLEYFSYDKNFIGVKHKYQTGTHIIRLMVSNHAGESYIDKTIEILPGDECITCFYTARPTEGCIPLKVEFHDVSSKTSVEGKYAINKWYWSLGSSVFSEQQNPMYVYTEPGIYKTELTVWNEKGTKSQCQLWTITAKNCPEFYNVEKSSADIVERDVAGALPEQGYHKDTPAPQDQGLFSLIVNLPGQIIAIITGSDTKSSPDAGQKGLSEGIKGSVPCESLGLTDCSGTCVNLLMDEEHCSSCSNACQPSESCVSGTCIQATGPETNAGLNIQGTCQAQGKSACGLSCVDLFSDPKNCGTCGYACPTQQKCLNKFCVETTKNQEIFYPAPNVQDYCQNQGKTGCNGNCVDLQTDSANCGACGYSCPAQQKCVNKACIEGTIVPEVFNPAPNVQDYCQNQGKTGCNGNCVDLQTDSANCGTCGNACRSPASCRNGICVAATVAQPQTTRPVSPPVVNCDLMGKTSCNGKCADLQTDMSNCGSCGRACPTGYVCDSGKCCTFMINPLTHTTTKVCEK